MHQQVFIGQDSWEYFSNKLKEISPKEIFLVKGKSSFALSGVKDMFKSVVLPLQCNVTEFFDFSENPKIEDVWKGLYLLSNKKVDIIIGIGGGSVLDMAKLIRFFYSYSGDISGSVFEQNHTLIPLVAIPTTAGTGSEATHFAVLYKGKTKYSIAYDAILPNIAVIYPPFTYHTSKYVTACAGFDALAQAIEAYWNVYATKESDSYAVKAIELLWDNLQKAANSPSEEIRDKVSEGAYWAGKAINITKTTAPHAMSYAFTSYFGIPHGHAVALTFPYFAAYNTHIPQEEYCGKITYEEYNCKMNKLYDMISLNKSDDIFYNIKTYIETLGLDFSLPMNFNKEIISNNINFQRAQNNPRTLTKESIKAAIESIFV